jgi:NAD(P) transhydrogenase alpha subunit
VAKAAAAGVKLVDTTAVPRITTAQTLDVLSSQAKLAGHRAVIEAVYHFQRFLQGEITAAGKYPPAHTMVLGVGVAGLAAMGTANALGSPVRAWDVRDISDQVTSMGGKWITVDFKEEGAGAGGYAKESSAAFAEAQKKTFHEHAKRCDIVITTAAIPGRPSPKLLEEYMIKDMKPGSVIVDLGSVGGGNCVGTVPGQKIKMENGVSLLGYTDFPARMAYQASAMFAGNMANLMDHIQGKGKAEDFFSGLRGLLSDKDAVVDAVLCVQDGESRTMPPPPQPSPISPKKEKAPAAKAEIKKVSVGGGGPLSSTGAMMFYFALVLAGCSASAPNVLVELLVVFTLACVVGYMLVWGVEPALHTPLMSVSNAISGQVVLGGLFMVSTPEAAMKWFGVAAIFIAAINVFGGFTVTRRMLAMYQTSDNDKKAEAGVPRTIGAAPKSPKGQTYAKLTPGAE